MLQELQAKKRMEEANNMDGWLGLVKAKRFLGN